MSKVRSALYFADNYRRANAENVAKARHTLKKFLEQNIRDIEFDPAILGEVTQAAIKNGDISEADSLAFRKGILAAYSKISPPVK